MSLEKIMVTSSELGASKSLCRNKLKSPLIGFYDKMKVKLDNGAGLTSLEGNIAIDTIETFFGSYNIVKQKLGKSPAASLGTCGEMVGLYALFVASSYAYSTISKHIETESSYSEINGIQDPEDEHLLISNLAKNYLAGTIGCRNGKELAEKTKGYLTKVKTLAQRLMMSGKYNSMINKFKNITIEFENDTKSFSEFKEKKKRKKSKKKNGEDEEKPITFKDVGGNNEVKSQLIYLVKSINHPDKKKFGYKPPRGIFFYGIPGTGKTLLAKALANECGLDFNHIDLSEILSKWYGESEQNLRKALYQEGIIFLDEFDSIGKKYDGEGYGEEMSVKIVNIIAEAMNGYEANEKGIFVAASNSLKIDPKLKRAGRFDKFFYFGPPTYQDIMEIFGIHLKNLQDQAEVKLYNGVDITQVSKAMYARSQKEQKVNPIAAIVGSDIAEITRRVHERKWNQYVETGHFDLINSNDFYQEINKYSLKERFSNEF